ncbi:MAG TPA: LamG domain-containing protein [Phycisphaerales bacterium]|nr:LamG domain-containing protein [Phycisphaerales bacterium]
MCARNTIVIVGFLLGWSAVGVSIASAEAPSGAAVYIGSPSWYAQFDGAGYCDWCLWGESDGHEVEDYHEMLSGEWGAAIYYDGIESAPAAMWLTDKFIWPNWETNSDFTLVSASSWDNPSNPVTPNTDAEDRYHNPVTACDTGQSVISNSDIEITIDYEVVDLGNDNSPLGLRTFANGWGYARSDRYVLLQTYTITNISGNNITGIEFYQMLHGHPANEYAATVFSVYESIEYVDPLEEYTPYNGAHSVGTFRYAITQWNDPDHDDATADHADWIGFGSTVEPDVVENGYYEGGHNYNENNRPDSGTHDSVEDRLLNGHPYSFGEVAGAMGWHLGTLAPQASVSLTLALMFGADFQEMKAPCQPPVAVAHWKFDEGTGTVVADSVGSNDGTLVGGPEWVDGWTGVAGDYALEFDGSNHVALSYPINVLTGDSVTVSAWVQAGVSPNRYAPILAQWTQDPPGINRGYYLCLDNGKPTFYLDDTGAMAADPLGEGEWHFLMGTNNGTSLTIYVDGVEAASVATPSHPPTFVDAYIGSDGPWEYSWRFYGTIDDVWVYGCPLTPDDDCFPTCHPDYGEWAHVGEPECWCFESQCHGDADGQVEGGPITGYKRVFINDLDILLAAYNVKEPPDGPGIASIENGICADFAHDVEGSPITGYKRVFINDLNILVANWNILEPPHGPGIPADCLSCGGGESLMAGGERSEAALEQGVDFEAMMAFLEGLWLDEEALKGLDEDALLKVMESVAEAMEGL